MNGRMEHDIEVEKRIQRTLEDVPSYVEEWDLNLKASNKTVNTRLNYILNIKKYMAFINNNMTKIQLSDFDELSVQRFFVSIQTKQNEEGISETSDSYKCMMWATLNSFFSYMIKRNYITKNPVLIIDKPKNHDLNRINQNRTLLTEKDFNKILKAVDDDVSCMVSLQPRNKAILLLFMTTGMRKTALTEINIEDINFEEKKLQIIDKRKKVHVYPLYSSVIDEIEQWLLERRHFLSNKETDALFINKYGDRIGKSAVDDIIKRYSEKGLGNKISPHKLRSGVASILYNKTHDLEFVRRAIGHADIGTTTRYIVTEGKERQEAKDIMGNLLK